MLMIDCFPFTDNLLVFVGIAFTLHYSMQSRQLRIKDLGQRTQQWQPGSGTDKLSIASPVQQSYSWPFIRSRWKFFSIYHCFSLLDLVNHLC